MKTKFFLTIGGLFILAGGLLAYQPLSQYWELHHHKNVVIAEPIRDAETDAAVQESKVIEGKPVRIVIPSLKIDLTVADGFYNPKNGSWTLSNDKAHYAVMTPQANNQAGNTFIYGHNRPQVFAKLPKLALGERVLVYTDNGHIFTYRYRSAYETSPNDDSLFRYQGLPILTLQTCTGIWFQNRYLMTFDLVGVA